MTVMLATMKITVQFTGNDSGTRYKYVLYSNADSFIEAAHEVTEYIQTAVDDDAARGPEAWVTGMEIERTR